MCEESSQTAPAASVAPLSVSVFAMYNINMYPSGIWAGPRARWPSLLRSVSSLVCVQMVSALWAGMMSILQAGYHEGNQTAAANQPVTHVRR